MPCEKRLVRVGGPDHLDIRHRPDRRQVLDRLVGRAVLADPERVVGPDEDRGDLHDRRHPHRSAHVVTEDEEGGAVGPHALDRQRVDDRPHRVLADAEVQVAAVEVVAQDVLLVLEVGRRRRREISRSSDQLGHPRREPVQRLARGCPRGDRIVVRAEGGQLGDVGQLGLVAAGHAQQLGGGLRVLRRVLLEQPRPLLLGGSAALLDAGEQLAHLLGDGERLAERPAEVLLGQLHLLGAEWRPVGGRRALLVRRAVTDHGRQDDQRRPVGDPLRLAERQLDLLQARLLRQLVNRPPVGLEAAGHLLTEGEVGRALDRDLVVVVDRDQLAEPEVAGQRGGLGGDPLLHAAVPKDHVGVVIDDRMALAVVALGQDRLGERKSDRVREALAERTGRHLDAVGDPVLRMPGTAAAELAEALDVIEGDVVAAEVQQRVLQHAGMSVAENEAVPCAPRRIVRAHPQHTSVKQRHSDLDPRERGRHVPLAGGERGLHHL